MSSVKDKILLLLQSHPNQYISGQEIAKELCISRTAVWKAIQTLRSNGYPIDAVSNKGYLLSQDTDLLSAASICNLLSPRASSFSICIEKTVTSTNDCLKQRAAFDSSENIVLIAQEQSKGRGRYGRSFFSPSDTGLYMSILLHPDLQTADSVLLTTAAAVAAACAIENLCGEPTQIKWINDIWMRGKKIAGILTEASVSLENNRLEYAILGIGINVYNPIFDFPDDILETAGSIFETQCCKNNFRNKLAAEILNHFMEYYPLLETRTFLWEYRKRLFVLGQDILVINKGNNNQEDSKQAKALELNDYCHLKVQYEDGTTQYLDSGEIQVICKEVSYEKKPN